MEQQFDHEVEQPGEHQLEQEIDGRVLGVTSRYSLRPDWTTRR